MGSKKKQVPTDPEQLNRLFEAATVLMTNQLRELAIDSISSYVQVFDPPKDSPVLGLFPGFVIHVVLDGTSVQFEPGEKDYEVSCHCCTYIHTYICSSVSGT